MDPTVKRLYQFLILLGIGAFLFLLVFATPVILNSCDFSMYNPSWNGCSDIAIKTYTTGRLLPTFYFEENELTLGQRSFADYDLDAANSAILIIGPRTVFSSREGDYMTNFLQEGGILLLADDFGTANDLLEKINTSSRFSESLLLDLSFEKNASFVTIFDFPDRSHPLTSNVSHILLNYPTSIIPGDNATVLAVSSEVSWLDTNLDGKQDKGEPMDAHPVLVTEGYGEGEIVLFSGPSLLINSMKTQLGNDRFQDNLFHYLYSGRDTVIIDESHRVVATPMYFSYLFPTSVGDGVKVGILLLVVCVFIVAFTGIPGYLLTKGAGFFHRSEEVSEETSAEKMMDVVLEKHPAWNKKKLEYIVSRLR